jgi:hypothetical protein
MGEEDENRNRRFKMTDLESKLFFVLGHPKSGTTWIQMLLNAHPNICCRPEDQFHFFIKGIPVLLDKYNGIIRENNRRTAQQGLTLYNDEDALQALKMLVMRALFKGFDQSGIDLVGTKDNSIIPHLGLYATLFPKSKFVFVVRDPRDIAVSSWFHNIRVEDNFLGRAGSMQAWAKNTAKLWKGTVSKVLTESENMKNRLFHIRYEDLHVNPLDTLTRLLSFLSADHSQEVVGECIEKSSFSNLTGGREQGTENQASFFRKGITGDWKNHLDPADVSSFYKEAPDEMKYFNYLQT